MTSFTAAPGMLVRRGYHVRDGEEDAAAAGEVRTIASASGTCTKAWLRPARPAYR